MEIGSSEAFASMQVPEHSQIFLATADIQACFYQCQIPADMSSFFGLPSVSGWEARQLGVDLWEDGTAITDLDRVYFGLTVLPMGFSWAMWFIQRLHVELVRRALVPDHRIAIGAWPFPLLEEGAVEVPYCDNISVIGLKKDRGHRHAGFHRSRIPPSRLFHA